MSSPSASPSINQEPESETADCDICLSTQPTTSLLTWDCNQCTWCHTCIQAGLLAAPMQSDWPQNWCGHDSSHAITLLALLPKIESKIEAAIHAIYDEKLRDWSGVKCPQCFRISHPEYLVDRVLACPHCRCAVCVECHKDAHAGQCTRTSKEDLKAVLLALRHEGAAMCPRCRLVSGRTKEGCDHIVCPKPCCQEFCFKCSKEWKECRGKCNGGAVEGIAREAEAESPGVVKALLRELRGKLEDEVKRVNKEIMSKKMLERFDEQYEACGHLIKQALQDKPTHELFEEVKDSVDAFLDPFRRARGVPPGKREKVDSDKKKKRQRSESPDAIDKLLNSLKKGAPNVDEERGAKRKKTEVEGSDESDSDIVTDDDGSGFEEQGGSESEFDGDNDVSDGEGDEEW